MLFGCPPPQAKMRCVEWECFVPDPTPRSCDVDDPTPFKYPNSDSPVMTKPGWDVTKDSRCYCTRDAIVLVMSGIFKRKNYKIICYLYFLTSACSAQNNFEIEGSYFSEAEEIKSTLEKCCDLTLLEFSFIFSASPCHVLLVDSLKEELVIFEKLEKKGYVEIKYTNEEKKYLQILLTDKGQKFTNNFTN